LAVLAEEVSISIYVGRETGNFMQYHVLGGDGKQYGPIDVETLRRWADEGRILPDTQVRDDATGFVSTASEILQSSGVVRASGIPTRPCQNCGYQCDINQTHCPNCGLFMSASAPPVGVPGNEAAARKILGMSVASCIGSCLVATLAGIVVAVVAGAAIFKLLMDFLQGCAKAL